jgi:hypothetical protein
MKNDRLYQLLPAFTRLRDADSGEVLRALLAVVQTEVDRVQGNIEDLYDSWFIETCPEWLVPYIGDLLGIRSQYVFDPSAGSSRRLVANTLGFRRRKGTASMLEDLARAATGWPAREVEYFRLLAATEHLNHVRPRAFRTPDLRDTNALELLDGPFETTGHLVDVRHIASGRGKHNIPHVGLFLWRLEAFAIERAPASPAGPARFRFGQLGADSILFNPARTDTDLLARTDEGDVPGPLRPRALYDELEGARAALAGGHAPQLAYLGGARPAFRVFLPADGSEVPPELIQICDLSAWATLPPARTVTLPDGSTLRARVAVDPRLGRLAFVSGTVPATVHVSYHHGFSAPVGGGSYERALTLAPAGTRKLYQVGVADPLAPADAALADALATWVADGRPDAIIEVKDSGAYTVADLDVPAGGKLEIRAANHQRPVLRLGGDWELGLDPDASLSLNGFLVAGGSLRVSTRAGGAGASIDHFLALGHCTLVPGLSLKQDGTPATPAGESLALDPASTGRLTLRVERSLLGRVALATAAPDFSSVVRIESSVVDGSGGSAEALAGVDVHLGRTTVFGGLRATTLHASECILAGVAHVARTQVGCVRFSWVEPGGATPRCYRCQPALALTDVPPADQPSVVARTRPTFTSTRYGDPGYAQLRRAAAAAIREGAEDGSEMGVFQELHQPQRETNLRTSLDEYLRFGLEAGIFFVT